MNEFEMIRSVSASLLCVMILSVSECDSAKYLKHTKLNLLKEILGRYFTDVTCTEGHKRPQPKVSFAAKLSRDLSNVNSMVIKFESVLTNEGNGYDKRTGTFTAPTGGMYLFSWHILSNAGKKVHAFLYVNNKMDWLSYANNSPQGHDTGSATVILRLKRDDKVEIRTAGTGNYLHNGYTTFTGTLLYQ